MKQKSRVQWNPEGETISKHFFRQAQYRRRKNSISGMLIGGNWSSSPEKIKTHLKDYFIDLFKQKSNHLKLKLEKLPLVRIKEEDSLILVANITLQEVEAALKGLNPNKAPGPDGLNDAFIKKFWDYMKKDFMSLVGNFQDSGKLPVGLNSSFITLIPKVSNPKEASDYRPISLINFSMKIILKVLANRLSPILQNIISDHQSTFIKQRNISKNILVTNEIQHGIQKGFHSGIILKLDFAKAFDSISWIFLEETMIALGFPSKWIFWILNILRSAKSSVLANGPPSKKFFMEKGLRQGSPLLYNLVAEMLSQMITKAMDVGILKGVNYNSTSSLTHLQFADDTVFFVNNEEESVKGVKYVLKLFEMAFGLKIYFHKSFRYGSKHDVDNLKRWAEILNCKVGEWPFKFPGASVGASPKRADFWESLVQKFEIALKK